MKARVVRWDRSGSGNGNVSELLLLAQLLPLELAQLSLQVRDGLLGRARLLAVVVALVDESLLALVSADLLARKRSLLVLAYIGSALILLAHGEGADD